MKGVAEKISVIHENFLVVEQKMPSRKGEKAPLKRKIQMRIWGTSSEKAKKQWVDYLLKDSTPHSLWVALYVFKVFLDRFIKKRA